LDLEDNWKEKEALEMKWRNEQTTILIISQSPVGILSQESDTGKILKSLGGISAGSPLQRQELSRL
jgi:hypothetical protein